MGFEMHYPSFADQQASFTPERNPIAPESNHTPHKGIVGGQTRGARVFGYKVGASFMRWRFGFLLTEAEHLQLDDFVDAALGAEFEFQEDPDCGSIIVPTAVHFAPGMHDIPYQRTGRRGEVRYRVVIELVGVPEGS